MGSTARRAARVATTLTLTMTMLGVAAGCANDDVSTVRPTSTAATSSERADGTTTTVVDTVRSCDQEPTLDPVEVTGVGGATSDVDVASFDGTIIRAHWYPAPGDGPNPTVLMGPGWSQPGAVIEQDPILFGALGIAGMNDAGYNVVTWDPRGFGASTGLASVNDPLREGRDVQALLDWVATQPAALLDRAGDPRVGMVGASYGGGIQLTAAAIDCRVDVLVPSLAWNSLSTSLYRDETVKAGWAGFLNTTAMTFGGRLDPHITSAARTGVTDGVLLDEDRDWFVTRGPGDLVDDIDIPTLFVQGTVDTLFTPDESIVNFASLRSRGVPTAMIWFCGGHGTCLTDEGSTEVVNRRSFAWLERYLKGDESVDVGEVFDTVDQAGARWTADGFPTDVAASVSASGSGRLVLDDSSSAGPLTAGRPGSKDILSGIVLGITPAKAAVAVEVRIDPGEVDGLVVGAPRLQLEYSGTTPPGDRPTRLFAQLVDDDTGIVLGSQITPVPVELDGADHQIDVDLESVAFHLRPGHTVTLQLVATTVAYAKPRLGGEVDLRSIEVSLPVVDGVTKV